MSEKTDVVMLEGVPGSRYMHLRGKNADKYEVRDIGPKGDASVCILEITPLDTPQEAPMEEASDETRPMTFEERLSWALAQMRCAGWMPERVWAFLNEDPPAREKAGAVEVMMDAPFRVGAQDGVSRVDFHAFGRGHVAVVVEGFPEGEYRLKIERVEEARGERTEAPWKQDAGFVGMRRSVYPPPPAQPGPEANDAAAAVARYLKDWERTLTPEERKQRALIRAAAMGVENGVAGYRLGVDGKATVVLREEMFKDEYVVSTVEQIAQGQGEDRGVETRVPHVVTDACLRGDCDLTSDECEGKARAVSDAVARIMAFKKQDEEQKPTPAPLSDPAKPYWDRYDDGGNKP